MSENNIISNVNDEEVQDFLGSDRGRSFDFNFMLKSWATWLTTAVRRSDLANIASIIQKRTTVHQHEEGGDTPFFLAIYLNRLEVVELLVGNGSSSYKRDSINTLLSLATREEYINIVEFLVDKGATIYDSDAEGKSPLFWAIENGKLELLNALVSRVIPKNSKNNHGDSPLIAAIKSGASKAIVKCLLKNGADINDSTLLWLAQTGAVDIMRVLIENGADGNVVGDDGNTPLATAVRYRQIAVVKYLTALGVNICKVGNKGKTPLQWAVINQDMTMVEYFLDYGAAYIANSVFLTAIETKNLQIVQMLYERGADKKRIMTQSPLSKAVEVRNFDIAIFLQDNDTNFANNLSNNKMTYLITFIEQKHNKMVKFFLEKGARLEMFGKCGNTPLTKAICMEHFEMVKSIVQHYADVNQLNRFNLTSLTVAAEIKDIRIFRFLVEAGANLNGDPKKDNQRILNYYEVAVDEIRQKQQIQQDLALDQGDAEETKKELVGDVEDIDDKKRESENLPLIEARVKNVSHYFNTTSWWQTILRIFGIELLPLVAFVVIVLSLILILIVNFC